MRNGSGGETVRQMPASETLPARLKRLFEVLRERYDRFASAKPPASCCITGVALEMEAKADAERRARRGGPAT